MDGYLATVTLFAGNFAPLSWAYCDGSLVSIASNTALYALLGTTYGGDGQVTFALPDLRGRVPVGTGQGPGLSNWELGEVNGTTQNTMTTANLAAHNHYAQVNIQIPVNGNSSDTDNPEASFPSIPANGQQYYSNAPAAGQYMGNLVTTANLSVAGASQPINNMQPFLVLNYIICTEGIFPSRN